MNTPIFLSLPHEAAYKSARALAMALGLIPKPVKDSPDALAQLQEQLERHPRSVALVDLGSLPSAFRHLLDLADKLPSAVRQQIILFRHEQGPVWPSDQAWGRQLGFAGLFAEIDPAAMLTESTALPSLLAQLTKCQPLSTQKLSQYFAAMSVKPDPLTLRGFIRVQCNRDAESLAQVMSSGVKSVDRSYRLSSYPACFVGTDAVQWLRSQYRCSNEIAIRLGRNLSMTLRHRDGLI